MATLSKGQTFGSTEQVTNTKLHALVDSGSVTAIVNADCDAGMALADSKLAQLSTAEKVLPKAMYALKNLVTGATVADISTGTIFNLYTASGATGISLCSITGATAGQEFTLVAQQASYPVLVDVGIFNLSADWIPQSQYDNLRLVWDGTNYIEISRVTT